MSLIGGDKVKAAMQALKMKHNDNIRGVYLSGLKNIVQETPADKGRARNNFFLTVNSPSNKTRTGGDKTGSASLASLLKMPEIVLGKTLYYTNNLPYIKLLEYGGYPKNVKRGTYIKKEKDYEILSANGYSLQRPGGWVRKNIIKMKRKIKKLFHL